MKVYLSNGVTSPGFEKKGVNHVRPKVIPLEPKLQIRGVTALGKDQFWIKKVSFVD